MPLKYKFDIPYKTFNEYLIGDKIKEDAAKNAQSFAGTSFLLLHLLLKMNDIESDTIELQVDNLEYILLQRMLLILLLSSSVDSNYILLAVSSLKLSPCLLLIFRENINSIQSINQIIFLSHFN